MCHPQRAQVLCLWNTEYGERTSLTNLNAKERMIWKRVQLRVRAYVQSYTSIPSADDRIDVKAGLAFLDPCDPSDRDCKRQMAQQARLQANSVLYLMGCIWMPIQEIKRWLSRQEHWLLLLKTGVQFPGPTWHSSTICNSSLKGSTAICSTLWISHTCDAQIDMQVTSMGIK